MNFSMRSGDYATCDVRGCTWSQTVEVEGGADAVRSEVARRVDEHRRQAHPWLSVEFTPMEATAAVLRCGVCGAAVADEARHRTWHETARV